MAAPSVYYSPDRAKLKKSSILTTLPTYSPSKQGFLVWMPLLVAEVEQIITAKEQ